ncbi:hypothetical protein BGP_4351 [Beggiatoa sp. PS]|nr:hypothetical protein BGP_4351 [Beggiatoa sp. PS]
MTHFAKINFGFRTSQRCLESKIYFGINICPNKKYYILSKNTISLRNSIFGTGVVEWESFNKRATIRNFPSLISLFESIQLKESQCHIFKTVKIYLDIAFPDLINHSQ